MPDIPTIITSAITGGLASIFIQTYFSMRVARIELMNDFIKDLGDIEHLAEEYWHRTTLLDADDPERKIIAAKLRGKLHAARCFRREAQRFLGDDFNKFDELDRTLFRAATGGDFETSQAKPDFSRAGTVMTTCAEIRSLLRLARRKAYWAR